MNDLGLSIVQNTQLTGYTKILGQAPHPVVNTSGVAGYKHK